MKSSRLHQSLKEPAMSATEATTRRKDFVKKQND
jgi:hypothetical protein